MPPRKASIRGARAVPAFDVLMFLESPGTATTVAEYGRGETIFTQGDPSAGVMYIQTGGVRLSVCSKSGRDAVVATLGSGDFFGEGCLAGQPVRTSDATAITPSVIQLVAKDTMVRLLRRQRAMADRFIAHVLSRNRQIEQDLTDHLFNSCEKRLARTLLLMARYGELDRPARVVPHVSHEALADMLGTTQSIVKSFLNKFTKLGFIECSGERPIAINRSLLNVVLQD